MDASERARLRALCETIPAGDVTPCCDRAGEDGHHSSWALGLPAGDYRAGRIDGATGWNGQRLLDVDAPAPTVTGRTNQELASPLDRPSPTVTATEKKSALNYGSRGAATASRRAGDRLNPSLAELGHERLTVRDCARLQSFPDEMEFGGAVDEQFRQVGNAVPPLLGEAVARAIRDALTACAPVAARCA